jgi:hypothetical protein
MPVFVFAAVAALFLLVRRTWKASKKRRAETPAVSAQEPEVAEDEAGDFRTG